MDEPTQQREAAAMQESSVPRAQALKPREPIEDLVPLRRRWWPESFTLVRDAASAMDWTLMELAKRMGYGPNQVWRKSRVWDAPNVKLLLHLCDAVQLPMQKVVAGDFAASPLVVKQESELTASSAGLGILALLFAQTDSDETVKLPTNLLQQVRLRRRGLQDVEVILDTVAGPLHLRGSVVD